MVHCPCSAIFNLLLHPCRHNLLRPPRVSRQKLHYSRLHSLTHRHSWFLPHLLLPTSHPHNLTSRTACPCLVPIYCPSISHPHPPHTNPRRRRLLVLCAISRLIYLLWLKTTTIQRGTGKKVTIFIIRGPVSPISIDLYHLHRTCQLSTMTILHIYICSSRIPLAPHPPCLVGRRRDDRYPLLIMYENDAEQRTTDCTSTIRSVSCRILVYLELEFLARAVLLDE